MATIRDAFTHFADNTCIRFKEVPTDQQVSSNHILITGASAGYTGWNYVSSTTNSKQEAQLPLRNRASAMYIFVAKLLPIAVMTYSCV